MGRVEAISARLGVQLLIALLVGAACSVSSTNQQPTTGADIVIGVPNAVTGAYNVEGPLTKQGYDLWADWANSNHADMALTPSDLGFAPPAYWARMSPNCLVAGNWSASSKGTM